jgi:hypothetical protein
VKSVTGCWFPVTSFCDVRINTIYLTNCGGNEEISRNTQQPALKQLLEKRQPNTAPILSTLLTMVLPSGIAEIHRRRLDGIV